MTWPIDDLDTTHFDAGSDNPAQARPMFKRLIDRVKTLISARGVADGVCELDANAKVPTVRIGRGQANGVASLDAATKVPRVLLPDATKTDKGACRLATDVEVDSASGDGVVTAGQLGRRTATTELAGLVELATDAVAIAGTSTGHVITPASLKAALDNQS